MITSTSTSTKSYTTSGYSYKPSKSEVGFKSEKGLCKINNTHFTKISFGANYDMRDMIGKIIKYTTGQRESRHQGMQQCYLAGRWAWDRRDITLLDEKGNEIKLEKQSFPKPKQFNPNFLDI